MIFINILCHTLLDFMFPSTSITHEGNDRQWAGLPYFCTFSTSPEGSGCKVWAWRTLRHWWTLDVKEMCALHQSTSTRGDAATRSMQPQHKPYPAASLLQPGCRSGCRCATWIQMCFQFTIYGFLQLYSPSESPRLFKPIFLSSLQPPLPLSLFFSITQVGDRCERLWRAHRHPMRCCQPPLLLQAAPACVCFLNVQAVRLHAGLF